MLCERCVWAHRHIDRGKMVLVVCPFARCVLWYGWSVREEEKLDGEKQA